MTTRRQEPLARAPKRKRAVFKMQSIRIGAGDNRRMKQLAARLGMSFNLWAVQTLLAELDRFTPKREEIDDPSKYREMEDNDAELSSDNL